MCKKPKKTAGGSSSGGGTTTPEPAPAMGNLQMTGFWGADFNGQASPALVEKVLAGGYCNGVMLKKRMADQGSLSSMIEVGIRRGAKFVLISQDHEVGVEAEAAFIETCISILTPARIVGIICGLDEWDLNPYVGHIAEIENYVAAVKARAQGIPVGINFSLGYGLTPACGSESILEIDRSNPDPTQWVVTGVKGGVPQNLDMAWLEGYPNTNGWFQAAMWPKAIEPVAKLFPATTRFGIVGQIWEDHSQLMDPDAALIRGPFDTWAGSEFADRIDAYVWYRLSDDSYAGDCRIAPGRRNGDGSIELVLPEAMNAVKGITAEYGLNLR